MGQAVLLGVSAAISHSFLIFVLAALALHFGHEFNAETVEPYLQIGSAIGILLLASWMFLRTRRDLHAAHHHGRHHHDEDHEHDAALILDTGREKFQLSVFESGVPPVFRVRPFSGQTIPSAGDVTVETVRSDGARQTFGFELREDFLESRDSIPEPHDFDVVLKLSADGGERTARALLREDEHGHGEGAEFQDAHELEHAEDIRRRFHGGTVTTPQIVLFGITGGLMPCPAAFSVLLICIQLKRIALGSILVGSFSVGLALTMVATGALAAWSVRHAERKFSGFGEMMRRAPYVSCVLLVILASYMAYHGWHTLPGR
jgi:nickel/cobalt exporter